MNKPFLFLALLLCLVHGQSNAQQPGSMIWSTLNDLNSQKDDSLYSIKLQSDGKIVVAGNSYQGSYMVIAIGRYNGAVLDPSFGNNGITTTSLDSAHIIAHAVELQPDGKIVVAGSYKKGAVSDFILARYKPGGSPDSSFGIYGIVRTDISSGSLDEAIALSIQTDGKIVATGRSGSSLALCRYNADGSLDNSFDSDGKLTVAAAAGATCMKLQTDGKMVVCGGSVVVRLMPDGSLDNSFGTSGVTTLTHNFHGMAIQNDGKIVLAGDGDGFVLQRLSTAGVIDGSFGTGGLVTTHFAPGSYPESGSARWICLQADGRIVAGGYDWYCLLTNCRDFAIARYESNGALDFSFGNHGQAYPKIPGGGSAAMSYSATINSNNELVVAGIDANDLGQQNQWALAGYYLGPSLDVPAIWGEDGEITVAPNPAGDFARLQSTHVENGNWHLSICDLAGRTLYSETIAVTNNAFDKNISLVGLPAAMYLVKLDNGVTKMTVRLTKSR